MWAKLADSVVATPDIVDAVLAPFLLLHNYSFRAPEPGVEPDLSPVTIGSVLSLNYLAIG